ncbi:MAG: glycosyltransferase family 39 protein [Candidatus Sumerlaeaceae bacterium]|nr:glycosyltransferase family 39 protein [Candidatus Sumerlaeaceae bacterium]
MKMKHRAGHNKVTVGQTAAGAASVMRIALGILAAWSVVAVFYLFRGRYVNDEGWYCLISREMWRGRSLYGEVRFSQMPLLPWFYGFWLQFLPSRIESGRIISLLVGFSGLIAVWRTGALRYGAQAGLAGLVVLCLSRALPYDLTNVKTQSMSFALGAWTFYAAARVFAGDPRRLMWAALAGILAGLGVACRLSLLPLSVFLPVAILLSSSAKRFCWRGALVSAVGSVGLPMAVSLGYYLKAGDAFVFGVYKIHDFIGEGMPKALIFREFVTGTLSNNATWWMVMAVAAGLLIRLMPSKSNGGFAFELLVLCAWLCCTIIHMSRVPSYYVYQMSIAWGPPLLGAWLWKQLEGKSPQFRRGMAGCTVLLGLITMPLQDGWLEFKEPRSPADIFDAARTFRENPGKALATLEVGLAFCAPEIKLLPGYEMSEFSFVPFSDPELSLKYRGLTPERVISDLRTKADFTALRAMDLEILDPARRDPDMRAAMAQIQPLAQIQNFGQLGDLLLIGAKKR